MEARETGVGEERTARRPAGRRWERCENTATLPTLELKEKRGNGKKRMGGRWGVGEWTKPR